MEGVEILGVVHHAHVVDNVLEFSRLRPTHIFRDAGWVPASREDFPVQGLVYWFKPEPLALGGTLWFFRVVRQPKFNPEFRRFDAWQVDPLTARQAVEGLEPDGAENRVALRRKLADGGLNSLGRDTVGPALLRMPQAIDHWIGPISLNASDRRVIRPRGNEGYLEVRQIPAASFDVFEIDGSDYHLLRSDKLLASKSGYFNIQRDEALLRNVVDFVRSTNLEAANALGITRRLVESYAAALGSGGNGALARMQNVARLEAAKELVDAFQSDWNLDEETIDFVTNKLAALPSFRGELEKLRERELSALRAEIQRTLDAEFAETRSKLDQMRAEHASLSENAVRLRREMRTAADALVADIVPKVTENILVRAILGAETGRESDAPPVTVSKIETRDALRLAMQARAAGLGVSADVMQRSTILLAASGVLLAAGNSASRAAAAAAQLLSSNHAVRVSVSTTMFDITALLAAPCAAVGTTSAVASSLGDFLAAAVERDSLSVVILEGCNRAPPENVFRELADLVSSDAASRSAAWVDCDGKPRSAKFDHRVLFICTLMEGQTVFPFTSALAYRWPIVWTEKDSSAPMDASKAGMVPTSVSLSLWNELGDSASWNVPPWVAALRANVRGFDTAGRLAGYLARAASASGFDEIGPAEGLAALVIGRHTQRDLEAISAVLTESAREHFSSVATSESSRLRGILEGKKGS